MLFVMYKSTHEEHSSQPLQTQKKQFNIAITFLSGYNGIFNVKDKNNKFYFTKSNSDEARFIQITTLQKAYKLESLNDENKRIIVDESHYTEVDYPFTINPNSSTRGSITKNSP